MSGSLDFTSCMDEKEKGLGEEGERGVGTASVTWAAALAVLRKWTSNSSARLKCKGQGTVREVGGRRGYGAGPGVVHVDYLGAPPFSTLESRVLPN